MPQHRKFAANRRALARTASSARREQQPFVIGEGAVFEVKLAHRLLCGRPVRASIPVDDWVRVYGQDALDHNSDSCSGRRGSQVAGFDVVYAMRSDPARSLVVAMLPDRSGGVYPLVIEVRYRLYRAWGEHVDYLLAKVLSLEEGVQIVTEEPMCEVTRFYRQPPAPGVWGAR